MVQDRGVGARGHELIGRIGKWRIPASVFLFILAFAIRFPFFGDPSPDFDEQYYFLVGSRLLSGQLPYVDLWDRKPFLLFVINAIGSALGGGMPIGAQLLAAASAGIAATQVFSIGRHLGSVAGSLIAGTMFLLSFPAFWAPVAQSEVFYIPLLLGMLQLMIRIFKIREIRRVLVLAAWVMLLGGLSLQIKYTTLPHCALAGLIVLARLRWLGLSWPTLVVSALGFIVIGLTPTALIIAFYAEIGHFSDFWYANFVSIFARGQLEGDVARMHLINIMINAAFLVVFAAAGALRICSTDGETRTAYLCVAGFTLASVTAFLLVGSLYSHYFLPVVPGLALLAVPFFSASGLGALIGLGGVAVAVRMADFPAQFARSQEDTQGVEKALALIEPNIDAEHCLYVFDGPSILYQLSGSCLPTKYSYPDHLNNMQERRSIGVDPTTEVRKILSNEPGAIVISEGQVIDQQNAVTVRLVRNAIAQDYVLAGKVKAMLRSSSIYVRRNMEPGAK